MDQNEVFIKTLTNKTENAGIPFLYPSYSYCLQHHNLIKK